MNKYIKNIIGFLMVMTIGPIFFLLFMQKESSNYPATGKTIQLDSLNRPIGDELYFPIGIGYETGFRFDESINSAVKVKFFDTSRIESVSAFMQQAEEPILSAKYLGHDSYRLLVLEPPVFKLSIRITKYDDKVGIKYFSATLDPHTQTITSVSKKDYELSTSYWDTLSMFIDQFAFWTKQPSILADEESSDWVWYLEGHRKSSYKIMKRWSNPSDYKVGRYLIYIAGETRYKWFYPTLYFMRKGISAYDNHKP